MQPANILSILLHKGLNRDKFKDVNDEQLKNIKFIFETLNELKLLGKFNEIKEEQPENIESIYNTWEILKFVKFNEINDIQL